MFTQLKAIIAGVIVLVLLIAGTLIYWRGSSNATTKNDLRTARETIKVERETKKVEEKTDTRVNAEGIETATKAQEAVREIDAIRSTNRPPVGRDVAVGEDRGDDLDPDATARIMQLAWEARAAAVESSAKLQPARASTR